MIFTLYILVLCTCFVCSLVSFRLHYAWHLRLFSVLIGISVLTEWLAFYGPGIFNMNSNYLFYNVFLLLQYIVYAFFFRVALPAGKIKNSIPPFIVAFGIFWLLTSFTVFGLQAWNSYVVIVGDVFTILAACHYFYTIFTADTLLNFSTSAEFWITAGLFIYCSCELPVTGMLNYLAYHHEELTLDLYAVLQWLNILMYSIFLYAFLCPLKINTTKSS